MFKDLLEKRRSIYNIGKKEVLPQNEIIEIIEHTTKHVPSSFNIQSARIVTLFGIEHEKFWDMTREILRQVVPENNFAQTDEKMDSFKAGLGTILFFEDQASIENLHNKFPLYPIPTFSEHGSAIVQYAMWLALAEKNIGATLQHYSPLVDEKVQKIWNIPTSWKMIAQMPFGSIEATAGKKTFIPIEDRVKIYK